MGLKLQHKTHNTYSVELLHVFPYFFLICHLFLVFALATATHTLCLLRIHQREVPGGGDPSL